MRVTESQRKAKRAKGAGENKKSHYYTHAELFAKIKDITQRLPTQFSYSNVPANTADLIEFLFRINFLVASKKSESGSTIRMYYDFSDQRLRETRLGKWDWEVHMAYRWAIQHDADAVWNEIRD